MNENNEFTQEQANKELLNELRNINLELKKMNTLNIEISNQNSKIINELDKIHGNTSFFVFIFWLKIFFWTFIILATTSTGINIINEFIQMLQTP